LNHRERRGHRDELAKTGRQLNFNSDIARAAAPLLQFSSGALLMKETTGIFTIDQGKAPCGGQSAGMLNQMWASFPLEIIEHSPAEKAFKAFFRFWHAGLHRALVGLSGSLLLMSIPPIHGSIFRRGSKDAS